jgi:hypothetical protein
MVLWIPSHNYHGSQTTTDFGPNPSTESNFFSFHFDDDEMLDCFLNHPPYGAPPTDGLNYPPFLATRTGTGFGPFCSFKPNVGTNAIFSKCRCCHVVYVSIHSSALLCAPHNWPLFSAGAYPLSVCDCFACL